MTREFFGHCVPLAGLHSTSFYTPSRLYRQYGLEQHVVTVLPDFEPSRLRMQFLEKIQHDWPGRRIEWNLRFDRSAETSDDYKVMRAVQAYTIEQVIK